MTDAVLIAGWLVILFVAGFLTHGSVEMPSIDPLRVYDVQ